MSKLILYLLDESKNMKGEIQLKKPKTFQELQKKLNGINKIPKNFEIIIFKENNEILEINNEEKYKKTDNILFIREININNMRQTLFNINYNKLSESKQAKLDDIYNCILCEIIIENEDPYLCYKCQKIFHQKCLKDWYNKCKSQNKIFNCPNCRNELPIEKWNKKLCYGENLKDTAILLNTYHNLNDENARQGTLLKRYENIIKKYVDIIKIILYKLDLIHSLMDLEKNDALNELISIYTFDVKKLEIAKLSKVIDEELDKIKNYIINKNKNKCNPNENIFQNNKIINNQNIIINKDKYYHKKNIIIRNNLNKINNININNKEINNIGDEKKNINKKNKIKNNLNEIKVENDEKKIIKVENKKIIDLIYFSKSEGNFNIFGKKFVENNQNNINLIINGNPNKLIETFNLKKGENLIRILINKNLINIIHMFSGCKTLKDITGLKNLDVKDIKDFSHMFYGCSQLSDIKSLQNWNVSNSNNFSYMFNGCSSLSNLKPLENWNVSNCSYFSYMFQGCASLTNLKSLENWNVSKSNSFYRMFCRCTSLKDINSLRKWNTLNCNNFSYMFQGCSSILDIKGLENWNVSNSNNFKGMFYECSAISDVNPIENWNTSNCKEFKDMFSKCTSLLDLSSLKKWNISLENMNLLKMN